MEKPANLAGTRKAQAFTIRTSGLDQPTTGYGEARALYTSLLPVVIARSHFEGPVRGAIEQNKMPCPITDTVAKIRRKIGTAKEKGRKMQEKKWEMRKNFSSYHPTHAP